MREGAVLRISTTDKRICTVVAISGRIDVYTASAVGETIQSLIAGGTKSIVLDLSSVTAIDSSGLGTLVGNAKAIAANGGTISLVGLRNRVRRMLEVTNLVTYFRIGDDVDEAVNELENSIVIEGSLSGGGE